MRMYYGRALLVLPLLITAAGRFDGGAQVPPNLVLTNGANGTTNQAVVGQKIEVDLAGNLSTGYAWMLARLTGTAVATNGPMTYTVDSGGGVGAGGTFRFPFLAVGAGDAALAFNYQRSGDLTPLETLAVTLHITDSPPVLSIKLAGSNAVISWPIAGSTNFFLEGNASFQPGQWLALNVAPLPVGTNYTVTLGTAGNPLNFRLHHF